jgi:hypothetical protein
MSLLNNKVQSKVTNIKDAASKTPSDRFVLGESECYFESAKYFTGKLDVATVKRLFMNPATEIHPTEGKSLKVLFNVPKADPGDPQEIKFIGFVTQSDASLELGEQDIPAVLKAGQEEHIIKAVTADEMVDMF